MAVSPKNGVLSLPEKENEMKSDKDMLIAMAINFAAMFIHYGIFVIGAGPSILAMLLHAFFLFLYVPVKRTRLFVVAFVAVIVLAPVLPPIVHAVSRNDEYMRALSEPFAARDARVFFAANEFGRVIDATVDWDPVAHHDRCLSPVYWTGGNRTDAALWLVDSPPCVPHDPIAVKSCADERVAPAACILHRIPTMLDPWGMLGIWFLAYCAFLMVFIAQIRQPRPVSRASEK